MIMVRNTTSQKHALLLINECLIFFHSLMTCCALRLVPPNCLTTKRVFGKCVSFCRCTKTVVRGPLVLLVRNLECASGYGETQHSQSMHFCILIYFYVCCRDLVNYCASRVVPAAVALHERVHGTAARVCNSHNELKT